MRQHDVDHCRNILARQGAGSAVPKHSSKARQHMKPEICVLFKLSRTGESEITYILPIPAFTIMFGTSEKGSNVLSAGQNLDGCSNLLRSR